jgi:hypothetical protein
MVSSENKANFREKFTLNREKYIYNDEKRNLKRGSKKGKRREIYIQTTFLVFKFYYCIFC